MYFHHLLFFPFLCKTRNKIWTWMRCCCCRSWGSTGRWRRPRSRSSRRRCCPARWWRPCCRLRGHWGRQIWKFRMDMKQETNYPLYYFSHTLRYYRIQRGYLCSSVHCGEHTVAILIWSNNIAQLYCQWLIQAYCIPHQLTSSLKSYFLSPIIFSVC